MQETAAWGLAVGGRFFIGTEPPALGVVPAEVEKMVGALLQHGYNEFTYPLEASAVFSGRWRTWGRLGGGRGRRPGVRRGRRL